MNYEEIIETMKNLANPENVAGMARFGISSTNTYGIKMPEIRLMAKNIKKNHELALQLWDSEIHEARILAALIVKPELLTEATIDKWVEDFESWDVCDQVCSNAFEKSSIAVGKIDEWAKDKREFVRRAAFALIAVIAVHHKKQPDEEFLHYLDLVVENARDERNFVKKAVNWSLRSIGKRSHFLRDKAIETCIRLRKEHPTAKSAIWIASDAERELTNDKILARIKR